MLRSRLGCSQPSAMQVSRGQPSQPFRAHRAVAVHRRALLVTRAHAAEASTVERRPGDKKGFVEEMRFVAMRLHTKDQAPKEGQKEASKAPLMTWSPTREAYLRFLVESKLVFEALERITKEGARPEYLEFVNTGLERSAALAADIQWMCETYGLQEPAVDAEGPGSVYSRLLERLAVEDPPAFVCHYYNVMFAHTAGGRMIGSKVSGMLLDGQTLEFYKYEGDLKALLGEVRTKLDVLAAGWSREQKDRCLQETETSFKYSGDLLRLIAGGAGH